MRLLYLFLTFFLFLSATSIAQSANDYRTVASGNWETPSIWEVYNDITSTWDPATNYPGELTTTNDVFILGNDIVTLNGVVTSSFNSLTIGPGEMIVNTSSSLITPLITLIAGGTAEWTSNNTTLSLPADASVVIDGGFLVEDNPCNATKRLAIGGTVYATCNGGGGGVDYDFGDINTGGGTLSVAPTANDPLCVGETLTLFANPSGAGSTEPDTTLSWSGTGPGGYSFSSTLEDPTDTGLIAGSYTYTLTIEDEFSNTFTSSIIAVVNAAPDAPVSAGNQLSCNGNSVLLTATAGAGETINWYDASTEGVLLLAASNTYSTSTGGSYFTETIDSSTGCVSTTRTEIVLTSSSCKVITNRRITYRVKKD